MKDCPACAEEVQDAAKVCRHCGYDFKLRRNPNMTSGDVAGCALNGCLLWIFGPIIALLLLAALGSLIPSAKPGPSPYQLEAAPSVQPGTVNQQALDEMFPPKHHKRRH